MFAVRMLSLASAMAVMLSSTPVPTADPTPAPVPAVERYGIYLPDRDDALVFDGNGKPISAQYQFDLLRDEVTNEPRYKQYTRTEDTGKNYEDGSPIVRTLCALYDMEDKLVQDWSEYAYRQPFGDFTIRMDSVLYRNMMIMDSPGSEYYYALWNVKTGKEAVKGTARVDVLDEASVLLQSNYGTPPLGVMDIGGETPTFRPFPAGYTEVTVWDGHIIAYAASSSETKRIVVMTKDFKPILEKSGKSEKFHLNGSFIGLRGEYLSCRDGAEQTILAKDGRVLYTVPQDERYDYFDGELMLLRKENKDAQERSFTRRMVKMDGTMLAGGYDQLTAIGEEEEDNDEPARSFMGVRGETIELLDRNGKVIVSQTIPNLNELRALSTGDFIYNIIPENSSAKKNPYDPEELYGLLNSKLEIVIPADSYYYISEIHVRSANLEYERSKLLQCQKTISGGVQRRDILDTTGKLLIENLTSVGDAGQNRLAVVKGFSVGVMDWQGNWIGKQSIFDSLDDEKQEDFW